MKCQEMGIIPRSENDLPRKAQEGQSLLRSVTVSQTAQGDVNHRQAISLAPTLDLNLMVRDMWCPACAWVIEEALKRMEGVVEATCNFSTDRLRCTYDPSLASPSQIVAAAKGLGYETFIPDPERQSGEKKHEFIRFAVSTFLTLNVMMLSFALYSGFFMELSADTIGKISWPIFAMATVVLFYGGGRIYQRAWTGMTSTAGMETLIATGSLCAYGYSTFNLLSGNIHLYYDTASMLITLFLLGKAIERRAKDRIQTDVGDLASLQPTKVRLCSARYPEGRYVSARALERGDIFRMDEDEVVAADGTIVEGDGLVDESSLTGEALPVRKKSGDGLRAGTRIRHGMFRVKAEKIGADSTLGQMMTIMDKALGTKARLEGKTDHVLRWFVPTVLALAGGTAVVCLLKGLSSDTAVLRAVTVMVISCPCAVGVAIPLARVAGISLAGRRGILVRDFSAFEAAPRVNAFIFDKTGTVTQGHWALLDVTPFAPFTRANVLAMAASLEAMSDHYVAMELKRQAKQQGIKPAQVINIRGFENGASGQMDGGELKIGSKVFLAKEVARCDPSLLERLPAGDPSRSLVYLAHKGKLCAVFVFGDKIKEGASETVARLMAMGHRTLLVSGDGDRTTKAVGRSIGIQSSHGGRLPLEKVALVKGLQEEGHGVAMVGDGINDAPALVQADLAFGLYSGSHLTDEAPDITLMRGDPRQVLDFLNLANTVNKKVHQNLLYSFLYNAVSVPVAMSGLLNPLIAVSAMLLSSLSVIGNTLLLSRQQGARTISRLTPERP